MPKNLAIARLAQALPPLIHRILRFEPHMTLSYNGQPVAEHLIEPIRWRVDEFVLINSHSGKSIHEVVGCWPLRK
jgi:2'-5' RNA ligase